MTRYWSLFLLFLIYVTENFVGTKSENVTTVLPAVNQSVSSNPVCDSRPCQNNGTCRIVSTNQFACICLDKYDGKLCEQELKPHGLSNDHVTILIAVLASIFILCAVVCFVFVFFFARKNRDRRHVPMKDGATVEN